MTNIPVEVKEAMARLCKIAQSDTGQSRRVANFLLAWWNASELGGFDLTDLWNCDGDIVRDIVTMFIYIATNRLYPDALGYDGYMRRLVSQWRSKVVRV